MSASIIGSREVYTGWCRLHVADFRLPSGEEFSREIEDHGDAVAVLPYDEERRTVVLVRLLRAPVAFGGADGMLVEAPAGIVEPGENPESTARREALEEVGLRLGELEPVAHAWCSPGISTEKISLYLCPYKATDVVGTGGGVSGENESIEVLETDAREAWSRATSASSVADLKTLTLLMALRQRRPGMFGDITP